MISVVITTKNRKELLKKAIESVLNQTMTDFECIVVDDNSSDGTSEYVQQVSDARVRYVYISEIESKGGNYARNLGIQNARGAYIAFLDDDDIWFPEKLELQKAYLDSHPNVGMVFCRFSINHIREKYIQESYLQYDFKGDCSKKIFTSIPCTTSTIMIRSEVLRSVGGFDEKLKFWQEYDLCIRLCQITNIGYVRKILAELRCDITDKNRLTNKFFEWVEAVKYQNQKYAQYISKLTLEYKKRRRLMIYRDAALRCYNCGDKRAQRFYLWKIYKITKDRNDFINWLRNRQ